MSIIEKAQQLNDLAKRNPEEAGALLTQALELLGEMAKQVVGLEADLAALTEQVGELTEQLSELDDDFQEICEDIYGDEEEELFEVECPNCGELMQIDEGILEDGSITCPGCDEILEFEFGCDCCSGCESREDCTGHAQE